MVPRVYSFHLALSLYSHAQPYSTYEIVFGFRALPFIYLISGSDLHFTNLGLQISSRILRRIGVGWYAAGTSKVNWFEGATRQIAVG